MGPRDSCFGVLSCGVQAGLASAPVGVDREMSFVSSSSVGGPTVSCREEGGPVMGGFVTEVSEEVTFRAIAWLVPGIDAGFINAAIVLLAISSLVKIIFMSGWDRPLPSCCFCG